MKRFNRFILIIVLWVMLLGFCAFVSTNVYLNTIVLYFGFCAVLVGFAYVEENMNEKELRFYNKWLTILNQKDLVD